MIKEHKSLISKDDEVRMILNATLDGVIIQNEDRQIEFVNKAVIEMFGDDIEHICREFVEKVDHTDRIDETEQANGFCFEWNGKYFCAFVTRLGSQNEAARTMGIIRDITGSKRMQQQLERSQKLKALGQMTLGVAHDFNNVLSAILGRAQLLQQNLHDQRTLESDLRIIEKAALDATGIIKRIQQFTRTTKHFDFTAVDVNEVVNDVVEMARPRWQDQAQSSGFDITVSVHLGEVPPVVGSASDLRELLINLVFNSIEAMPRGGTISIRTYADGSNVSISISDTGMGVPEQMKRKIFEPFFTTKGMGNSGLGLSIASGIIDRHNGEIEVDSREGYGTTFTINLPIAENIQKTERPTYIPARVPSTNILVIDDEAMIREILHEILVRDGHTVTVSASSREGLQVFDEGHYDIVYTDLGMPEMSGWEVASAIKKREPSTIVVMITGWAVCMDNKKIRESGIDLIVSKPFQVQQLRDSLAQAMKAREEIRLKAAISSDGNAT